MGTIHYVSERDRDLRHNIVLFISKTFHLQRKNEIKQQKMKKRRRLVAWWLSRTEWETVISEWGLGWEKHHPSMSWHSSSLSPYHRHTPPTHTDTHTHTRMHKLPFFLPQFKCLQKKKKNQSKTTERKVAESAKMQEGVEKVGARRIWRTNWAIRENYEDVHGSGNIILYFKKTTILWYAVTGASGGRQTVIRQNETDILSQCRLMTWKSCPYCVRELESIGLWNVRTHAHLWA